MTRHARAPDPIPTLEAEPPATGPTMTLDVASARSVTGAPPAPGRREKTRGRYLLALLALAFSVFALWVHFTTKRIITERVRAHLETQRDSSAAAVVEWLEGQLFQLRDAGTTRAVRDAVKVETMPTVLRDLAHRSGASGYLVTDRQGVVVQASEGFGVGIPLGVPKAALEKWLSHPVPRLWVPKRPQSDEQILPYLILSAPIEWNTDSFGAIHLLQDPAARFSQLLSIARPGATGEAYAVNPEGLLLSRSRFGDALRREGLLPGDAKVSALNVDVRDPEVDVSRGNRPKLPRQARPLTRILRSAQLENVGSVLEPYRNYRGIQVVGAFRNVDNFGFSILTELEREEAYAPLEQLTTMVTVVFTLLGCAVLFGWWTTQKNLVLVSRSLRAEFWVKRLGQYTLGEKLGEGGMGSVFRAEHAMLRRPTAVKLLKPGPEEEISSERYARFEREVQLTAELTHPNTIAIYDYGKTPDGLLYYAMEYLDGVDLDLLVRRTGPLPPERAVHLLLQACASLAEAHHKGLIHRDVKPANLMLCERGGEYDRVKVLDFGLVKHAIATKSSVPVTAKNALTGTPSYMAPEALTDPDAVSPRSDVYALGCVLYFLISGKEVFHRARGMAVMVAHMTDVPARLDKEVPGIPTGLADLVERCLSKDPAERPRDAGELRDALLAIPMTPWTQVAARAFYLDHPEFFDRKAGMSMAPEAAENGEPNTEAITAVDGPPGEELASPPGDS